MINYICAAVSVLSFVSIFLTLFCDPILIVCSPSFLFCPYFLEHARDSVRNLIETNSIMLFSFHHFQVLFGR